MTPRGRRPGDCDTRSDIIVAARKDFATSGYAGTSLRGIARHAGVDPALIHHHFGSKADLFFAAVLGAPPREGSTPFELIRAVPQGPREDIGRQVVRNFLSVWDADGGVRFAALLRGAISDEAALRPVREFIMQEITQMIKKLGSDRPLVRAQLVATQIIGLATMRYVSGMPQLAAATPEALAQVVGPTIQRYLLGELPTKGLA